MRVGLRSHVHSYSKAAECGALIVEEGGDHTHIDAGDARDIMSCTPLADRLNGGMVRISLCDVTDDKHVGRGPWTVACGDAVTGMCGGC